jgi:hypothetical protein
LPFSFFKTGTNRTIRAVSTLLISILYKFTSGLIAMKFTFVRFGAAAMLSLMIFSPADAQTETSTTKKGSATATATSTTTAKKVKPTSAEAKLLKKIDARLKLTKEQEAQVLQMIQTSNAEWQATSSSLKKGSTDWKTAMNASAEKLEGNIKAILTATQLTRYTKYQSAVRKDLGWKAISKK